MLDHDGRVPEPHGEDASARRAHGPRPRRGIAIGWASHARRHDRPADAGPGRLDASTTPAGSVRRRHRSTSVAATHACAPDSMERGHHGPSPICVHLHRVGGREDRPSSVRMHVQRRRDGGVLRRVARLPRTPQLPAKREPDCDGARQHPKWRRDGHLSEPCVRAARRTGDERAHSDEATSE